MSRKAFRLSVIFVSAALILTACTSLNPGSTTDNSLPDLVKLQQENILEYVSASPSHLDLVPSISNWRWEGSGRTNGEYRFSSGSWLMVILPANLEGGDQEVLIIERGSHTSWCGRISPDGEIEDTCLRR